MDATSFYLLFIPGFTIVSFLIGSVLATIALGNRVDMPAEDEEAEGQPAH